MAFADTYRLTARESEVAVLIGDGYDLQAIASHLGLGAATSLSHQELVGKTAVRSQAALVTLLRGFTDLSN